MAVPRYMVHIELDLEIEAESPAEAIARCRLVPAQAVAPIAESLAMDQPTENERGLMRVDWSLTRVAVERERGAA